MSKVDTSMLDRSYMSSFTPKGKIEASKECPHCKNFLPATRFKGAPCKRNSIDGIARNLKCRQCESRKTNEKKHERTSSAEIAIDQLNHRLESVIKDNIFLRSKINEHEKRHAALQNIIGTLADKEDLVFDVDGNVINTKITRFGQKSIDKE